MKIINFKRAIQVLGYTVVKYTRGYNFRSAFAEKDGQMYYFHIEDLRDSEPLLYYRKVKDTNDYHGEANMFGVEDVLEELGYMIREPRRSCDYNQM